MERLFLGIDTSNYTTSAAVCTGEYKVLLNYKRLLEVAEGEHGLRQSDAVFQHIKALPEASAKASEYLADSPAAVGVSYAPRNAEGSYMPCFLAGISAAEFAAVSAGVPLYRFSHQQGHVMAALASACGFDGDRINSYLSAPFLAFHVSGGTTDLLLAEPSEEEIIRISRIGGTLDLNAGQVIDRTGVMMGFRFPAGASLDQSAMEYSGKIVKGHVSVHGTNCNLSGLENLAKERWEKTGDVSEVSAFVLGFISDTLEKLTLNAFDVYGRLPVVFAGGVMSSRYIRGRLGEYGVFASPEFSSDNAAGTALLTAFKFSKNTDRR